MTIRKKTISAENALERLETLCANGEQCTFDLRRKLSSWGISREDANKIIESLELRNFVDDSRFAHAYVSDKYRFNRWGRTKITAMLLSKRINGSVIREALDDEIDDDVYRNNAVAMLRSKAAQLEDPSGYESKVKLFRLGASHGYESNLLNEIIKSGEIWI